MPGIAKLDQITNSAGTGAPTFPNGIAGQTGTSMPAGSVGEIFAGQPVGNISAVSGQWTDLVTHSVTAGAYLIYCQAGLGFTTLTGMTDIGAAVSISGSANTLDSSQDANLCLFKLSMTSGAILQASRIIYVSSTTTVRAQGRVTATVGDAQWQQAISYLKVVRLF